MLIRMLPAVLAFVTLSGGAIAQSRDCSTDAFSKVVDDAAAVLRRHSSESQPRIQAGIRQLKERHGWRDQEDAERMRELLSDPETEALDHKAAQLLATMDRLSEEGAQRPGDCAKLAEVKATAAALSSTIRSKSDIILKRIEAAQALPPGTRLTRSPEAAPPRMPSLSPIPSSTAAASFDSPSAIEARAPEATVAAVDTKWSTPWAAPLVPPAGTPLGNWSVTTTPQPAESSAVVIPPPPIQRRVAAIAPAVAPVPPPAKPGASKVPAASDTYTIDEINAAARGGLGSWSASVGQVIEHAFSKYGRPTAYVIGEEGGGAFIAGVRYGKGKLYMKGKTIGKVYWHGPSVGYDFGAAGSETLFLIYGMREARDIYRGFSGIDGAAYFIGGAGITFLNNEEIIMAPIRTGYGFRLGASVGYLRFAARPTWNPF